jgi:hypothetical protein
MNVLMSPEKKERIQRLIQKILAEEDRQKFSELCNELNGLLEEKQSPLTETQKNSPH